MSQPNFGHLINHVPYPLMILEASTNKVVSINAEALRIINHSAAQTSDIHAHQIFDMRAMDFRICRIDMQKSSGSSLFSSSRYPMFSA